MIDEMGGVGRSRNKKVLYARFFLVRLCNATESEKAITAEYGVGVLKALIQVKFRHKRYAHRRGAHAILSC